MGHFSYVISQLFVFYPVGIIIRDFMCFSCHNCVCLSDDLVYIYTRGSGVRFPVRSRSSPFIDRVDNPFVHVVMVHYRVA